MRFYKREKNLMRFFQIQNWKIPDFHEFSFSSNGQPAWLVMLPGVPDDAQAKKKGCHFRQIKNECRSTMDHTNERNTEIIRVTSERVETLSEERKPNAVLYCALPENSLTLLSFHQYLLAYSVPYT